MSWLAVFQTVFGDYGTLVVAVFTFFIALGLYKCLKDWLPF